MEEIKKPQILYMTRYDLDKWRLSRKEAGEQTIIPNEVMEEIKNAEPLDFMKLEITFNSPMTITSAIVIRDLESFEKIILKP